MVIDKTELREAVKQLKCNLENDLKYSATLHKYKEDISQYINADNGFNEFLYEFSIARNLKNDADHKAVVALILTNAKRNTANEIAELLQEKGLSSTTSKDKSKHILPLSLVSKMLFLYRPDKYIPYDNLAFTAINTLGYKVKTKDYDSYLKAIEEYRDKNKAELLDEAKRNVDLTEFETQLKIIGADYDLFLLNRITDKLLWVIGNNKAKRKLKTSL